MTGVDDFVGRTTYRVLYGDVDQMGVLYHANFFRLFERGRSEYIRDRGLPYREIEERGAALPVTEAHAHYHRPVRYDDLIVIETAVGLVRRASIRFEYELYRQENALELLAEGWTLHACVSPDGKVIRLPEYVRELFVG
ncbi:MAG: thioesterase family protein [Pseudomonadota bacterium]